MLSNSLKIIRGRDGDIGIGIVLMLLIISMFAFYVSGMTRTIRNQNNLISAEIMRNKAQKSLYMIADRLVAEGVGSATGSSHSSSHSMFVFGDRHNRWFNHCRLFGKKNGLFIPPRDNRGMPDFLKPVVGKDPWGNRVAYYSWDLRTQRPPKPGLVVRFVSPGADGKIETTKGSAQCKGDDVCVDITESQVAYAYNRITNNHHDDDGKHHNKKTFRS